MKSKHFINPHIEDSKRSLWHFFLWKIGYYDEPHPSSLVPPGFIYPAVPKPFERNKPSAVWIGHSTYLIEVGGQCILTDPVWDSYCSPIPIPRLHRLHEPPISLADLPRIDRVLISHNHYDHLDAKTVRILQQFHPQIQWIVPEGLSPWFRRRGITSLVELGWWQTFTDDFCTITAVPTQHFSGRTLWDRDKTHWNGFVLETKESPKTLYFAGDTGYNEKDFRTIGERWTHMDLSLIPIGAYIPKKFMQPVHINPFEAVQIHIQVKSRFSLGMHWKTFNLSDETQDQPPYDLYLAMQETQTPFDLFLPIDIGTYVNW